MMKIPLVKCGDDDDESASLFLEQNTSNSETSNPNTYPYKGDVGSAKFIQT